MASTKLPVRYADPEYQKTHTTLFSNSITRPLNPTLPPGVTETDFQSAVQEFVATLGSDGVLIGEALVDYVDPYELYEDSSSQRKVPSAAVLSVLGIHYLEMLWLY
jgi:hypothetical protein